MPGASTASRRERGDPPVDESDLQLRVQRGGGDGFAQKTTASRAGSRVLGAVLNRLPASGFHASAERRPRLGP